MLRSPTTEPVPIAFTPVRSAVIPLSETLPPATGHHAINTRDELVVCFVCPCSINGLPHCRPWCALALQHLDSLPSPLPSLSYSPFLSTHIWPPIETCSEPRVPANAFPAKRIPACEGLSMWLGNPDWLRRGRAARPDRVQYSLLCHSAMALGWRLLCLADTFQSSCLRARPSDGEMPFTATSKMRIASAR